MITSQKIRIILALSKVVKLASTMSLETWIPLNVTRSSRSFFDPTYDVGLDWDDFGHHKRRLATSGGHSQRSREVHVQRTVDDSNLQRDMDRMFTNFYHLAPYERHVYKPRSPMTRRHLSQHAVSDVSYRCPQTRRRTRPHLHHRRRSHSWRRLTRSGGRGVRTRAGWRRRRTAGQQRAG